MQKGQAGIFLIVGVFIIAAVGGYLFYTNYSNNRNKNITSQPVSSQNGAGETANWKTYTSVGPGYGSSYKSYTLKYPSSWNLVQIPPFNDITLSKGNYSISIKPSYSEGSVFIFEGEVPFGPYIDYRGKKYTEIKSGIGTLRRVNTTVTSFAFCVMLEDKECVTSILTGHIIYTVPPNHGQTVVAEMDKIISTLKYTDQNLTNPSSLCSLENTAIKNLIDTFESLQMKKDALVVLKWFTPAVTNEEIDAYNFFTGKKTGVVGLYGNVTTNFNEPSYKITSGPLGSPGGCTVTVEEQRSTYSNAGANIGYQSPQPVNVSFDVVKLYNYNEWMIDNYYLTGSAPKKYGAWGY